MYCFTQVNGLKVSHGVNYIEPFFCVHVCLCVSFLEAFMQWSPVIDGVDLSDQPVNSLVRGQVASVPVLMVRDGMGSGGLCTSSSGGGN